MQAEWHLGRDTLRTTPQCLRRRLVRDRRKTCSRRNYGVVAREVLRQARDLVDMRHHHEGKVRCRIELRLRIPMRTIVEGKAGMGHNHSIAMMEVDMEVDMGEARVGPAYHRIRLGRLKVHKAEGMGVIGMGNHSRNSLVGCRGEQLRKNPWDYHPDLDREDFRDCQGYLEFGLHVGFFHGGGLPKGKTCLTTEMRTLNSTTAHAMYISSSNS
jgi:hypothetical protein